MKYVKCKGISNVQNLATGASKTSCQHENRISALRPILSSVVARGTELVAGASTDSFERGRCKSNINESGYM